MKRKKMVPHVREQPKMEIHHRRPVAQGGRHWEPETNQVQIRQNQHRAWHTLFQGDMTPDDIACVINHLFLDPRFYFVVRYTDGRKP